MTNDNKPSYGKEFETKQKEVLTVRKIVFRTLTVCIVLFLIGIIAAFFYIRSALAPVDPDSDEEVEIEVPLGSTSSDIATLLEEKELISNSKVFQLYLKFKNKPDFQAGEYTLSPSQTYDEIVEELQSGKVMEEPLYRITIPEGKAADQIAELLARKFDFTSDEFLDELNDDKTLKTMRENYPDLITKELNNDELLIPLEGYLYAGTYDFFEEEPSIESIINMMIERTNEVMEENMDEVKSSDLSIHEVLTLASVVERESKFDEDRSKVAQVFLNRLQEDMKLQSDITAAYANREHKVLMTYEDIETDSPYNTYVQKGLPPGPISSPSLDSIEAVVEPEGKDFTELYFYARPDGETLYSDSLEEHTKIKEQYEHEWHELEEEQSKSKKD